MLSRIRACWNALIRHSAFEREMDEELQFHLDRRADDLVRTAGLTRDEARRRARLEFGNPEAYQDRCREARQLNLVDDLRLDLRFASRTIRRDALLAVTVVATLAVGIGSTTAIFSVVNAVLLRPLPYPDPDRLVMIGSGDRDGHLTTVFGPDFTALRTECGSCEQVAAFAGAWASNLTGGGEPDRIVVGRVSDNFFTTMGVHPERGRTFVAADTGRPVFGGETPVSAVILSYGLWQRRFGKDPSVIGRSVTVEGDVATIVGVMPQGFTFPNNAEAWVPASINVRRNNAYLRVIARLRPGVVRDEAKAELQILNHRMYLDRPEGRQEPRLALVSLHDSIVGDIRWSLIVFLGAVGCVLLIACANVANLLLAQAATRPKELAVRTALGASRSRIVRQLLTESLLLSVLGGTAGVLLAAGLVGAFVALAPSEIPRLDAVRVDQWMAGFALLLSVVTGLLFGLAPVTRAWRPDLNASLQEGGGRAGGSLQRTRIRKVLVVGEVALALMLLIGAGLLIKSFVQLRQTPMGFDPDGTLTASVTLPDSTYPTAARAKAYFQAALDRLAAIPGVRAAGIVNSLPLGREGTRINGGFLIDGETKERHGAWARKAAVGGEYFKATGIPLLKGRTFTDRDTEDAPGVVIVSESLARSLWQGADPIGHRINIGFGGETWREVVGVVGDVKQDDINEDGVPGLYQPFRQVIDARRWFVAEMTFVIRTAGAPDQIAGALRSALREVDKDIPLYSVRAMTDVVAWRTTAPQFYALLLSSFSVFALVLAAAGVYGLISYSVSQRTHEIGIRMALGAGAGDVLRLIVGEGMTLVGAGTAIGIGGALASTRALSRFLYRVSGTDPRTFVSIALLLCTVALLACYLPARRATRVDPTVALRHE